MFPDRVALVTSSGALTYSELCARALSVAGALTASGASPGDRVAVAVPPGEEFAIALHGCLLAGYAAVPIDMRLAAVERAARAAGAASLLDHAPDGRGLSAPAPLELEAVAVVVHTSGTTASPRPIALTYGNWQASALGSAVALGLDPEERWLCPLPLVHVGGLSVLIRSAIYGTTAVVHERFSVDKVGRALRDPTERVTLVSLVPTMLTRLLDAGLANPPTLRWVLLGGGPIPPSLLERAAEAGVPVAPTYGMTEGCSQIATHGWPLLGVEVHVASADSEVLVRGPTIAPGSLAPDGWLHTGDLGVLDSAGRLAITGRRADTIVTGGENVAPAEVEAVLLAHPAVADAGVFSRPDTEWGEVVIARVVTRDGLTVGVDELRAFCAGRLARFKVPKAVEFADSLPRTESGKLLRREL
jgi:O-succinylbenzoic acid--CoA ligase